MSKSHIYLIESSNRHVLANMFMRFQEYYESPQFKGKTFSIDEFAAWYASHYGAFTYSQDWYGFNIPATVLEPFKNGQFDPLTYHEKRLIEFCSGANNKSYVIGATPSAEYFDETIRHEFVHGAFFTNKEYRDEVIKCLAEHKIEKIKSALADMGYHEDVAFDEANAYLLVEPETIKEYITIRDSKGLRDRLEVIFKKHFGFSVVSSSLQSVTSRVRYINI